MGDTDKDGDCHTTDLNRLHRFLCLGDETGCCRVEPEKEKDRQKEQLNKENVESIMRLVQEGKGVKVVEEIISFSTDGRGAKPNPVLFALAICAHISKDLPTVQAAYKAVTTVCRTPTQLFTFVRYSEKLKDKTTGWGAGQRKAITKWYNNKEPLQLAMLVSKYIQRNGWSHVDVLRLSHVKPKDDAIASVLMYVTKGFEKAKAQYDKEGASDDIKQVLEYLEAVNTLKHTKDEQVAARLIEKHKLVKEQVPTWLSKSPEIWRALLPHMPILALLKSLGKLSALKLLDPLDTNTCAPIVVERLKDIETIKRENIHPFTILLALRTYESGKGTKGKKKWTPNGSVVDVLNDAFYASFENLTGTGKRFLLALDISKSMKYGGVNGSSMINPATATAAMVMSTARSETNYQMLAFSKDVVEIPLNATMKLSDITKEISAVSAGTTDCTKPLKWALDNKKSFDVFVVYTDCETWPSSPKPVDVLKQYRKDMKIPDAKLVVCALTSQTISVADPNDCGMLDVAGFDKMTPGIINNFVKGEL